MVVLPEVVREILIVVMLPIAEHKDHLHIISPKRKGLKSRDRERNPAEVGVSDKNHGTAQRHVEISLCGSGRGGRMHAPCCFDKEPTGATSSFLRRVLVYHP